VVKVKHSPVMGALELRLGLSRMVTGNTSVVISYEVIHEFCITSRIVLLVGFRSYFKENLTELGLLGAKCPNQYEIYGLESSK